MPIVAFSEALTMTSMETSGHRILAASEIVDHRLRTCRDYS